jgi:type IV secretion system protein VirB8
MRMEDRFINPLGFQVLRYRRDAEALAAEPEASPPGGVVPSGPKPPTAGAAPGQPAPAPPPAQPAQPAQPEVEL